MNDIFWARVKIDIVNNDLSLGIVLIKCKAAIIQALSCSYTKEHDELYYRPCNVEDHSVDNHTTNILVPINSKVCIAALVPKFRVRYLSSVSINH